MSYFVPVNAHANGSCVQDKGSVSSVKLMWSEGTVSLVLSMGFAESSEKWSASSVSFSATKSNGPLVINGTGSLLSCFKKVIQSQPLGVFVWP